MKRYDSYKDSGVKWIGEIPSHWDAIKLKYKLQLINDKIVPNGLQYIGMENIESFTGKYVQSGIKAEGLANHFQAGDILFGKLRPYLAKAYQCKADGCCSTELLVYRNKEYPDFFKYTFLAKPFVDLVNSSTYGSKMPRANANFIGSQFIPVPPLTEQRAIVSFLDTELGKIDTYMDKEQQLIERLKELKQSLIARAVTHGIDPNVKMKPSGINWIGEIPEHWEVKNLRSFLRIISDKGHPKEQLLSVVREQGVIIRNTDSKDENHNFIPDDLKGYKLVRKGQFVINKMKSWQGSYAVSNYQGIVSPAYYTCDLRFDNKEFFNIAIRSKAYVPFFSQYSKGIRVGQWDLDPINLKKIPFFLPPLSEQRAIVDYLQDKTSKIDKLITEKTRELEYMNELRQRIISDAVTGKIDVHS
ncbi:restriction endonuclease subunit S [Prevotella sp. AGR2160]|uniref:restriction endonuclease subunit S n=1 Tax=Prevotella sp. AGR2160 TaxID=1280674 RepID=UPI0004112BF8|nr:restriction endonuclease subunit S [Prevotella sp. AGR2160]